MDFCIGTQYRKVELSNKNSDPDIIFKHPVFKQKILRAPYRGDFNNIVWTKYCGCFCPKRRDFDRLKMMMKSQVFIQDCAWPKQCANVAAYPGQNGRSCSFLFRVAPGPNSALLRGLPWATENMQIQGPKTIGHMNTYISMLDFTSVPAWIILYC